MSFRLRAVAVCVALVLAASATPAQGPGAVVYRLSFAERAHRLMDVTVTFPQLPPGPLQLRMSRSSPGRYALHEFAKNVLDVRAFDPAGKPLTVTRPDPYGWDVPQHGGTVEIRYRVFGDRVDGTYLGVDTTHAHINMPAALMWARGLDERPARVQFERPAGTTWRVATQLLPGPDEMTFTAPNLAYLMDSPSEVSDFALETFTVPDGGASGGVSGGASGGTSRSATIRLAVHHDGTAPELKAFTADVERIVRESRNVFRVFPAFEVPGSTYTFIADYLPWASGDGMEHRNSTVLTSPSSIRSNRGGLVDTVAHEFIHAWNVERIRPRSLEPFDFERANMSGELWLGEGFTSYYGPLVLRRAGLLSLEDFASEMGEVVNQLFVSPGRLVRSAREMSELAPFVDAATAVERTTWANTYVSYYTWGAGIGLGLDLTLRSRTDGRVTLDDFMRELWRRHGAPGGRAPGVVDRPYTMDDVRAALTTVSGDGDFARDFLASYVEGRELVDYPALLARAGIVLRKVAAGRATAGALQLADAAGGVRVMAASPFGSPAYAAGLDRDDTILSLGGARVASVSDWNRLLNTHKPGTSVPVTYRRRDVIVNGILALVEDPRVQAVPGEEAGQPPTAAQRAFRNAWLNSPGEGR